MGRTVASRPARAKALREARDRGEAAIDRLYDQSSSFVVKGQREDSAADEGPSASTLASASPSVTFVDPPNAPIVF